MPPPLPESFGPYRVVRELGRGGMGVVFEARRADVDRPLALKLLGAGAGPEARLRFQREAEMLARVRHPGIVTIHEVGVAPQGAWLVCELVPGEALDHVMARGPLPWRRAAELGLGIASAVSALHAAGLVHRDIKPANVILRPDGRPVLLDFGLAREESGEALTRTGELVGTPAYMPPEQVTSAKVDARADVYAVGATIFALLRGSPPFEGASAANVLMRVVKDDLPWASLPGDHPAALEAVLRRATAKRPDDRPATAGALALELERALAAPPPRRVAPALLVGVGVGALVAVLVLVLVVGGALGGRPTMTTTTAPAPSTAPTATTTTTTTTTAPAPSTAPTAPSTPTSTPEALLAALDVAPGAGRIAAWRAALAAVRAAPERAALQRVRARLEQLSLEPLATFDDDADRPRRTWVTVVDDERVVLASNERAGARRLSLSDGRIAPLLRTPRGYGVTSPVVVGGGQGGARLLLAVGLGKPTSRRTGRREDPRPERPPPPEPVDGTEDRIGLVRVSDLDATVDVGLTPLAAASADWSGRSTPTALAVSRDARLVAIGGAFPGVMLLDIQTRSPRWLDTPKGDPTARPTLALAFDASGRRLAVAGGDPSDGSSGSPGWIRFHDLERPEDLKDGQATTAIHGLAYGPRRVLLVSGATYLYLCDPADPRVRPTNDPLAGADAPHGFNQLVAVAMGPDGVAWTAAQDHLLPWRWDGTLERLPVPGRPRPRPGHGAVSSLGCTPDGSLVVLSAEPPRGPGTVGAPRPPLIEVWGGDVPRAPR